MQRGQLGLAGVIMPGLAQIAPAFNLFFTTGLMVLYAGASAPLIFLVSMIGMGATASTLARFAGGYIIAFGGICIFVGSYIAQNVFSSPHIWGFTQIITILCGVLVVAPVIVGLRFGVRATVVLHVFEVALLLALSVTILARGGASGLSATPFRWPSGGGHDVLLGFSLAVPAFGGFEAAAPLAEETRDPRRNMPVAVLGAVVVSGIIYVVGSYALVTAFGVGHAGALAADPNRWSHALGGVSPRFRTPAAAAFVAPSILTGVVSTAFTGPVLRPGSSAPTAFSGWSSCTRSRTSPWWSSGRSSAAGASRRTSGGRRRSKGHPRCWRETPPSRSTRCPSPTSCPGPG